MMRCGLLGSLMVAACEHASSALTRRPASRSPGIEPAPHPPAKNSRYARASAPGFSRAPRAKRPAGSLSVVAHQTPHPFFRQPNPMAALHANIKRELATSGLPSVILRPGMFAANTVAWWAPQIRAGDVVRWPYGAVETAPIDERDIAAVAVRARSPKRRSPAQTSSSRARRP